MEVGAREVGQSDLELEVGDGVSDQGLYGQPAVWTTVCSGRIATYRWAGI